MNSAAAELGRSITRRYTMSRKTIAVLAGLLAAGSGAAFLFSRSRPSVDVSLHVLMSDFRENVYSGDMEAQLRLRTSNSFSADVWLRISGLETNGPSGWVLDEAAAANFNGHRFMKLEGRTSTTRSAVVPGLAATWRGRVEVYRSPGLLRRLGWAVKRLARHKSFDMARHDWRAADFVLVADSKPWFEFVTNPMPGFADQSDSREPPPAGTAP